MFHIPSLCISFFSLFWMEIKKIIAKFVSEKNLSNNFLNFISSFISVYILNNILVLLSMLLGLFPPTGDNYLPKKHKLCIEVYALCKHQQYLFCKARFCCGFGFFFLFHFCETGIRNEQFSLQSNFEGNEKWRNVMKRKKSWNKAELFHNTHKITPSV